MLLASDFRVVPTKLSRPSLAVSSLVRRPRPTCTKCESVQQYSAEVESVGVGRIILVSRVPAAGSSLVFCILALPCHFSALQIMRFEVTCFLFIE